MKKWVRWAAASAMLGLMLSCLTPASAVVPTATSVPILVTAQTATTTPTTVLGKNNGKAGAPLTPKERAATKVAEATQTAQNGQQAQAPTSVPAAPGQQL